MPHGLCAGAVAPISSRTSRTRVRTYQPKPADIQRAWHVVDAEGAVLGRARDRGRARCCAGKHKPIWAPHLDIGDHVIVINAAKLDVSPAQARRQALLPPLGLPGWSARGVARAPARPRPRARRAPRGPGHAPQGSASAAQMLTKLRVYAGPTHPHAAQQPHAERSSPRRGAVEPIAGARVPKPLIQTTGRRKEAVAARPPAPGHRAGRDQRQAGRDVLHDPHAPAARDRGAARHADGRRVRRRRDDRAAAA